MKNPYETTYEKPLICNLIKKLIQKGRCWNTGIVHGWIRFPTEDMNY